MYTTEYNGTAVSYAFSIDSAAANHEAAIRELDKFAPMWEALAIARWTGNIVFATIAGYTYVAG